MMRQVLYSKIFNSFGPLSTFIMANVYYGTAICLAVALLLWRALRSYKSGRTMPALLLLAATALLLHLFGAMDFYLHQWDERYHALVARHMMRNPFKPLLYIDPVLPYDYRQWTANHVWLHKQPMALWSMALSMRIFGTNELALRLPSVLFCTAGVFLTFGVVRHFFNPRVALLAAYFFAVNGLLLDLSSGRTPTDHIDVHFLFYILLAVWCSVQFAARGRQFFNMLAGVALGLALLTKWLPALVVVPVWFFAVWQSGRWPFGKMVLHGMVLMALAALVSLPWQWYIHHTFPLEAAWEAGYNARHLTERLEDHDGSPWYYLHKLRINYGELIYLPLIWFAWKLWRQPRHLRHWAPAVWVALPLLVFSLAATKMQGYMLIAAPALFGITAAFWWQVYEYQNAPNRRYRWAYRLLLFMLLALPLRYAAERLKPFTPRDRSPAWVAQLKAMGQEYGASSVLFNFDKPIEAMFYTDMVVYPHLPGRDDVQQLQEGGYRVLIFDDGRLDTHVNEWWSGAEVVAW